jgi:hypothetical protein
MAYNDFGPPDSWYEPDCDPETPADYGWVREEDIPDLDSVKDFLKGVIEAVYVTGNVEELENCLDEICGQFDLKLPAGQPVVINRQSTKFSEKLFDFGVALSRAQANQLATR